MHTHLLHPAGSAHAFLLLLWLTISAGPFLYFVRPRPYASSAT